ncbi:MAG TPA: tetratricopeptide repeat protein, partial [Kineosporiaceae bacterium]|nr:tetratricopeptide repeat protein [Kineosporiaceae bacterium]
ERVFPAVAAADWRRARSSIDEAIEVNRRSGYGDYRTWFVAHLGWVARMQGRYEEALALGRRAVDASAQQGHRWWRPTAQALLATSLRKAGRTAEAADLLTEALAELGPDGAPAPRLRCLAELAAATGSRTLLDEADAALSAISVPPGSAWLVGSDAYLAVARCWLTLGSPERAGTIVAGLLRAAERQRWIPVLADAELVQGLIATALGDARAGVTSLTRARDLARRHGMANIEHEAQAMLAAAR